MVRPDSNTTIKQKTHTPIFNVFYFLLASMLPVIVIIIQFCSELCENILKN